MPCGEPCSNQPSCHSLPPRPSAHGSLPFCAAPGAPTSWLCAAPFKQIFAQKVKFKSAQLPFDSSGVRKTETQGQCPCPQTPRGNEHPVTGTWRAPQARRFLVTSEGCGQVRPTSWVPAPQPLRYELSDLTSTSLSGLGLETWSRETGLRNQGPVRGLKRVTFLSLNKQVISLTNNNLEPQWLQCRTFNLTSLSIRGGA